MKNLFLEFKKFDEEQRIVCGYCSTDSLDSHGEVITKEAMGDAITTYMEYANIREMHQPSAVGVAKSLSITPEGTYLEAHIVDPVAWDKVKSGVYKGFSIGGTVLKKNKNVINKILLKEISLVDRPANPDCKIQLWKLDDKQNQAVEKSSLSLVGCMADSLRSLGYLREYMDEMGYESNESYKSMLSAINCLCDSLEQATADAISQERIENAEEESGESMSEKLDKSEIINSEIEMDKELAARFEKMLGDSESIIKQQKETIDAQNAKIEDLTKSIAQQSDDLKKHGEMIEKLAATPVLEKGAAMEIPKEDDKGGSAASKDDAPSYENALKKFEKTGDDAVLFKHSIFGTI